jgi:hypothetical protein
MAAVALKNVGTTKAKKGPCANDRQPLKSSPIQATFVYRSPMTPSTAPIRFPLSRTVVAIVAITLLGCGARGQSAEAIPVSVLKDAAKTFAQGMTCHIWRDADTTVEVEPSPFGGNFIIVGPFYAIASPQTPGPVTFEPGWQLVAQDKATGSLEMQTASLKGPEPLRATAMMPAKFSLLVVGESSSGLIGKGPISIFLVEPSEKKGTVRPQISNALRLLVDIENKKIVQ